MAAGRLADTRLAGEHDEPAITTTGGRFKGNLQLAQFLFTANEGLLLRQAFPGQPLVAELISSRCVRVRCHLRCRAL
jgi:hypothetical protein